VISTSRALWTSQTLLHIWNVQITITRSTRATATVVGFHFDLSVLFSYYSAYTVFLGVYRLSKESSLDRSDRQDRQDQQAVSSPSAVRQP
jgi:hypothetical protein